MNAAHVVVVVEGQTELRQTLREVLTRAGYEVVPVKDAAEALTTLRRRSVQLLITNQEEATEGGALLVHEVESEFPDLQVIAMGDAKRDTTPFFGPWRVTGSTRTLRRPFRMGDLVAASREAVG